MVEYTEKHCNKNNKQMKLKRGCIKIMTFTFPISY